MITAFRLAGFFAAHAIWSVSDGETLIPILGYTDGTDKRTMIRLAGDDLGESIADGRQQLASNAMDATDAALFHDGYITLNGIKRDAILVDIRAYFSPESEAMLAIPYTPQATGAFRVHKPKMIEWTECDAFELNDVLTAFFEGVDSHKQGSTIWNAALDESF
jgi:hypothetical protein